MNKSKKSKIPQISQWDIYFFASNYYSIKLLAFIFV